MTNARNCATWHVARLFIKFVGWWIVFALATTMLGRLDLDPLSGPEDVVIRSSGAVSTAFSPLRPFADCRNWAGLWYLWQARWTTGDNLFTAPITAFLATMLCLLGDNENASLGPQRA